MAIILAESVVCAFIMFSSGKSQNTKYFHIVEVCATDPDPILNAMEVIILA